MKEYSPEAIEKVALKFEDLDYFTHAVVQGFIRGLVVEGDAGIGKTYGIDKIFDDYRALNPGTDRFEIIGGAISEFYLYKKLYEYRHAGMVLVFDDCTLKGTDGINIMKKALDSSEVREISWYKESNKLRQEGIPLKFQYRGGVAYLTNVGLETGTPTQREHMKAIVSRCHYLNMRLTQEEKLIRINQIVLPMLEKYRLNEFEISLIIDFVMEHLPILRELSLRTVTKIADLFIAFPERWERMSLASLTVSV